MGATLAESKRRTIYSIRNLSNFRYQINVTGKVKNNRQDDGGWPRWLNLRLKGSAGCTITRETPAVIPACAMKIERVRAAATRQLELPRVREFKAEIEAGTKAGS